MKRRENIDMVSTGIMGETEARGNYVPKTPIPSITYARNIMHPYKNFSKSAATPMSIPTPKSFYNENFVRHRFPTQKEVIDKEPERIMWMLDRERPPAELSSSQDAYALPNMAYLSDHIVYGRGVDHPKRDHVRTRPCPTPLSTSQEAFGPKTLPPIIHGGPYEYVMDI
jgi:hypothetical protein